MGAARIEGTRFQNAHLCQLWLTYELKGRYRNAPRVCAVTKAFVNQGAPAAKEARAKSIARGVSKSRSGTHRKATIQLKYPKFPDRLMMIISPRVPAPPTSPRG